ncbi:MAG: helix-turn-helix domain-containing protein [Candidatus Dormibacteraceae bacterium]
MSRDSIDQAATTKKVSAKTIRRAIASGELRASKSAGTWRVERESLAQWTPRPPGRQARRLEHSAFRTAVGTLSDAARRDVVETLWITGHAAVLCPRCGQRFTERGRLESHPCDGPADALTASGLFENVLFFSIRPSVLAIAGVGPEPAALEDYLPRGLTSRTAVELGIATGMSDQRIANLARVDRETVHRRRVGVLQTKRLRLEEGEAGHGRDVRYEDEWGAAADLTYIPDLMRPEFVTTTRMRRRTSEPDNEDIDSFDCSHWEPRSRFD